MQIGSVYYLYAGNLNSIENSIGSYHAVYLYTDYAGLGGASPFIRADFYLTQTPGTFSLWNNFDTYYQNGITETPAIYVGWECPAQTQPLVDLVTIGRYPNPVPDVIQDIYLVLGIGVEPQSPPPPSPGPSGCWARVYWDWWASGDSGRVNQLFPVSNCTRQGPAGPAYFLLIVIAIVESAG